MVTFGIIRERKNPPDRRVVFSPQGILKTMRQFPEATFKVESSPIRFFEDEDYQKVGIPVVEDLSECDVMLGVKEVPVEHLIPNKKYFFFSHTIKKQPYNRQLLQAVLQKNIELYDHEVVVNEKEMRLIGFGKYAGIVGAYNAFRTWGLKFETFRLPKAETLKDQSELIAQLKKIPLPAFKIVVTGKGRVGQGVQEMLNAMNIKGVSPDEFINEQYSKPVYAQLDVLDYSQKKDNTSGSKEDFFQNPEAYQNDFIKFAEVSDLFIAGHYYGQGAPYLLTREDVTSKKFNIKVIADISCDIDGPVAPTIRASTIENPMYGYNPETENEVDFKNENAIAVMAVDNLPCELPGDASKGFGDMFLQHVIPAFFNGDKNGILERARMTKDGKLTERFRYLQEYVDGNE